MQKLNKYQKIIKYLVSDVSKNYIDDLEQELYVKLLEILNNNDNKIVNIDNYIFIALRNKKYEFLNKQKKKHMFL